MATHLRSARTVGHLQVTGTYNNPGSPAAGTTTGPITINIVVAVETVLEIYNVPGNVIEGQSYTLLARELDGVTNETIEDPATGVGFSVGPGQANVTGGNIPNINAGSRRHCCSQCVEAWRYRR